MLAGGGGAQCPWGSQVVGDVVWWCVSEPQQGGINGAGGWRCGGGRNSLWPEVVWWTALHFRWQVVAVRCGCEWSKTFNEGCELSSCTLAEEIK